MNQPAHAAPTSDAVPLDHAAPRVPHMSLAELFRLFLRLGFVFGGGTAIGAALQEEVVDRRGDFTRAEFMTIYGLARIVPSGSSTALAVAFGYQYQKLLGTVIALGAMILPGFAITVLLTIGRELLVGSRAFEILNLTLMPAALAVVIVSTWKLAQEFFSPSIELLLVVAAFVGVAFFGMNPTILLVLGGILGVLLIRTRAPKATAGGKLP